jgi:hypothetical protein
MTLEQQQHTTARRVAEHHEVIEDRGFHPSIRIYGYMAMA